MIGNPDCLTRLNKTVCLGVIAYKAFFKYFVGCRFVDYFFYKDVKLTVFAVISRCKISYAIGVYHFVDLSFFLCFGIINAY